MVKICDSLGLFEILGKNRQLWESILLLIAFFIEYSGIDRYRIKVVPDMWWKEINHLMLVYY